LVGIFVLDELKKKLLCTSDHPAGCFRNQQKGVKMERKNNWWYYIIRMILSELLEWLKNETSEEEEK